MKLVKLGNPVMICILPETERREDGISVIYLTISISTICCLIKLGESDKPVSFFPRWRIRLLSLPTSFLFCAGGAAGD